MISAAFDGIVCDLDGVVYRGDQALPGAADAVTRLRSNGVRLLFCTNNSYPTVQSYVAKLGGFGIDVSPDDLLTSATVAAELLAGETFGGRPAFVVGGPGLRAALESVGMKLLGVDEAAGAEVVVVGIDPEFDYRAMEAAARAVRAGARFVATNDDATYPVAEGFRPGAGAILASIEVASGVAAEVMGKPHAPMMEAAARRLAGCERIAIVGDRPETDLAGGRSRGWTTVLVLTGVTSPADVENVEPKPDLVLASLADLG
jgi:HAD superfamily hydrolase (TIGR01450 family)